MHKRRGSDAIPICLGAHEQVHRDAVSDVIPDILPVCAPLTGAVLAMPFELGGTQKIVFVSKLGAVPCLVRRRQE
jgi:hypothetical protein